LGVSIWKFFGFGVMIKVLIVIFILAIALNLFDFFDNKFGWNFNMNYRFGGALDFLILNGNGFRGPFQGDHFCSVQ
jgi:hypothetical protein